MSCERSDRDQDVGLLRRRLVVVDEILRATPMMARGLLRPQRGVNALVLPAIPHHRHRSVAPAAGIRATLDHLLQDGIGRIHVRVLQHRGDIEAEGTLNPLLLNVAAPNVIPDHLHHDHVGLHKALESTTANQGRLRDRRQGHACRQDIAIAVVLVMIHSLRTLRARHRLHHVVTALRQGTSTVQENKSNRLVAELDQLQLQTTKTAESEAPNPLREAAAGPHARPRETATATSPGPRGLVLLRRTDPGGDHRTRLEHLCSVLMLD